MEIKYELLEDDYIKFNLYHLRNSSTYKKQVYIVKYVVNTVLAFMMFCIGTFIFNQSMLIWFVISILFLIIQIKTNDKQNEKRVVKQTKKLLKEGDNKNLFTRKILRVDNEKIYIKSEFSEVVKDKKSIVKIKVYDDLLLLYENSVTAIIIPTRYLESDTIDELINDLKSCKDKI